MSDLIGEEEKQGRGILNYGKKIFYRNVEACKENQVYTSLLNFALRVKEII